MEYGLIPWNSYYGLNLWNMVSFHGIHIMDSFHGIHMVSFHGICIIVSLHGIHMVSFHEIHIMISFHGIHIWAHSMEFIWWSHSMEFVLFHLIFSCPDWEVHICNFENFCKSCNQDKQGSYGGVSNMHDCCFVNMVTLLQRAEFSIWKHLSYNRRWLSCHMLVVKAHISMS